MAKIVSINISRVKGRKRPVKTAVFIKNYGLKGDVHASPGKRQVSLLAVESYERFKKSSTSMHCFKHGSFGENLTTKGVKLHKLKIGCLLQIGRVVLRVSKIGKECHAPCKIAKLAGSCIMPKEGIFAQVVIGGRVRCGENIIVKKNNIKKDQ
ncbi:MAG: MOSC domain-containing protein [Candidatus Woesearchaeota archaeon]